MNRPDRSNYPTRRTTLQEAEDDSAVESLSPGERVAMVWALTREAWTFKDGEWNEPRLRRDVGRVTRGRR